MSPIAAGGPTALVLTALPVEMTAVLAHLIAAGPAEMTGPVLCEFGRFTSSAGQSWRVVAVELGPGNVDIAGAVVALVSKFQPDVLMFVGIAGALRDDLNIGDVVAGTEVAWTERGKWSQSGYQPRARTASLSDPLGQLVRKVARDGSWTRRFAQLQPNAKAVVGQIASGEKVVADQQYRAWLRAAFSDALAIENEGFALARTGEVHAGAQRYVVRGISDRADGSKSDAGHQVAADAAAAFAFELLDAYSGSQQAERASRRPRLPLHHPVVSLGPNDDVSPATLLRPRHAVVSYVGREQLLDDLKEWREAERPESGPQLWFCTGPGGFGKTRLAVEACTDAQAHGWTAGLLHAQVSDAKFQELAEWPSGLLIAVDYAETRPAIVGRLVNEFAARTSPPVRIMLLVRRRASRPELLAMFNERRVEELSALLRRAPISRLDDATAEVDRDTLFGQATQDFGAMLRIAAPAGNRPQLLAPHFARPLYVLVAALLALTSPATHVDGLSEQDLLRELLTDHETRYWERWDERQKLGLDPEDRRIAVALATLLTASGNAEALTVARLIPHHSDQPEARLIAIARWLSQLYPGTGDPRQIGIGPLEPDRLGEVLVGDVLCAYPDLLATAMDAATNRQLTQLLTITGRIAQADQAVRDQLRVALDARMADVVRRGLNAAR